MDPQQLARLIAAARRREPEAFDALVDAYSSPLYGYLFRLTGSRDDAEELLQELFVRLVRMIARYQHDGRFEAWLFRIATNLARDRVRRLRRSPQVSSIEAGGGGDGALLDGELGDAMVDASCDAPDQPMRLREDCDALQRALAQLPAAEREVVMLRHYSDMTFAEIAAAMQTPLGTALARGHRGLQHLRRLLSDEDGLARAAGGDA